MPGDREPRSHRVLAGAALVIVFAFLAARLHFGRGQVPGELLVGLSAATVVVLAVFVVTAHRTYGRRR